MTQERRDYNICPKIQMDSPNAATDTRVQMNARKENALMFQDCNWTL